MKIVCLDFHVRLKVSSIYSTNWGFHVIEKGTTVEDYPFLIEDIWSSLQILIRLYLKFTKLSFKVEFQKFVKVWNSFHKMMLFKFQTLTQSILCQILKWWTLIQDLSNVPNILYVLSSLQVISLQDSCLNIQNQLLLKEYSRTTKF